MSYTFFVDFGSTYTKLCVFDLDNGELVMTTKQPTTVPTDASVALLANFEEAQKYIGKKGVQTAEFFASSSAAGGLRMVVVGLTKRFSLLAGKNVALGAGAKVIGTYENYLTDSDVHEIESINPEILLFCGGIEGGNGDRILHNARKLKNARISSHIVYAGNSDVASYVRQEMSSAAVKCFIAANVFPAQGQINARPAGEIIRDLFMKRIVGAKGLAPVFPIIGDVLMPTPAAVLAGGALLSKGDDSNPGLGNMMVFDIGGSTTDVYSYIDEKRDAAKYVGVPEPFAKRTVEGDLGVRTYDDISSAQDVVRISARRHCGKMVNAYEKSEIKIIEGKDLTEISSIVGTGGPIIHSGKPEDILSQALRKNGENEFLLPRQTAYYLDKEYLLYAVGLGAAVNPESVLHIAKEHIKKIDRG